MKIGLVCPISWEPLLRLLPKDIQLPKPLMFTFGSALAAALVDRGHEVHIFTLCHNMSGEQHVVGQGLHLHIKGYRKGAWRYTLDMYRTEAACLRRMISEYPCDIFHAHWTYDFALPVVTSPVRSVVSMRDNPLKVLWLFKPKSYRLMHLVLAYRVLWHTRHLLVASDYMQRYARKWHFYQRKLYIIPNAVAGYCFSVAPRLQQCGKKVVFACIANGFTGCKNVDTLLKAFGALKKSSVTPCELRLYGWPHGTAEQTQCWATQKGLEEGVVFCGQYEHRNMIEDIRHHADVLVHPSLEESFGNVIAEAMAVGIPTVVGRMSGAAPWVAGNGEAGLIVDVRSPKSLTEAMLRLVEDTPLRQQFGNQAYALANTRYRMEIVVQQHLDLYEAIVKAEK